MIIGLFSKLICRSSSAVHNQNSNSDHREDEEEKNDLRGPSQASLYAS